MNYTLTKKYTIEETLRFFAECAYNVGEKVQDGISTKDRHISECISSFLNSMNVYPVEFTPNCIYEPKSRRRWDIEIPSTQDIKNLIFFAKNIYIKHEHNKGIIPSRQTMNTIDEFLIYCGSLRGVEIDIKELRQVEKDCVAEIAAQGAQA